MALSSPDVDRSIRFNLTLPVTRLGFGPFSFDPIEQMIGCPVNELLESLMRGPSYRRPSAAGTAVEVYPLALPPGEGAYIPLGPWGELGFANDDGLLALTVPRQTEDWVAARLRDAVQRGPQHVLSLDGTARLTRYWVALPMGFRAGFPLGAVGEAGLEVA